MAAADEVGAPVILQASAGARKYAGESFIRHQDYHRLAEGYYTVEALMVLSERYQVELPICRAVHAILYENADPREQLTELLRRGLRAEFDD